MTAAGQNQATERSKQPSTKRRKVFPDPASTLLGNDTEISGVGQSSQPLDCVDGLKEDADQKPNVSTLFNFHIGIHFERLMEEYGVIWNTNVLFGEDKHRFFKKTVLCTNHRRPERQLLFKEAINFTIKAVLNDAFLHTDTKITSQLRILQKSCPQLLKEDVSVVGADVDDNTDTIEDISNGSIAATAHHLQPAVRGRLRMAYLRRANLPSKVSAIGYPGFSVLMRPAMDAYGLNVSSLGKEPLYWYEGCLFTSSATSRRITFHIGDCIRFTSGELVLIRQIYTHAFRYENVRRLFVWCQILRAAPYRDEILQQNVYKATQTDKIVPLTSLCEENVYIVQISGRCGRNATNDGNNNNDPDLLHCNWTINFL